MYLEHFGLAVPAFSIAPDPRFAYPSRAQQQALATLLQAIDGDESFVKITGEAGTGKTLACLRLLATLTDGQGRCDSVYLPNPCLTPRALLLAIARELKLPLRPHAPERRMRALLDRALRKAAETERRIVVCLDEAQAMPVDALEALWRLAACATRQRRPLQVVLCGRPELDDRLARAELQPRAARIGSQYRLGPLSAQETEAYLAHRLRVAGRAADAASLFPPAVAALVHRSARGVPRTVNIVAHKSLWFAFREGASAVAARHVRAAAAHTPYARPATVLSRIVAWWQQDCPRPGTPV